MNTTKSIYNKLFSEDKVELGKHEVELALVDDIKALYNSIKSDYETALKQAKIAASGMDKAASLAKKVQESVKKSESITEKLIKYSKDLGLDLPSEVKTAINQIQAYRSDSSELMSRAEKAADGIQALD